MKSNRYFRHDWGARHDPKMLRLVRVKGAAAKAVYWDLIEMLFEEGGKLPLDAIEDVSFLNHLKNSGIAEYVVYDSGLFQHDETHFWSDRQQRDEQIIKEISEVRRQAGGEGGRARRTKSEANAKQTGTKSEAINRINKINNNINNYSSSSKDSELCHPRGADDPEKPLSLPQSDKKTEAESETLSNKHCQQVIDFWNRKIGETSANLSKVQLLSEKRKTKIRVRWKEFTKIGDPVEVCRVIFTKACESKFMQGDNPRGWKANFDWVFDSERNWSRVYEGQYDNQTAGHGHADGQTLDELYRRQIEEMQKKYGDAGTDTGYSDFPEEQ